MEWNPTPCFRQHMDLHQSEGWLKRICSVWRQQGAQKALGRTQRSFTSAQARRLDLTPSPPCNASEPKGSEGGAPEGRVASQSATEKYIRNPRNWGPPSRIKRDSALEVEFHSQLALPRPDRRIVDHTEVGVANVGIGRTKNGMIEGIRCLQAQLELHSLVVAG